MPFAPVARTRGQAVTSAREHWVSSAYDKWKSKYGGMRASDIRRMKELEAENAVLKRMFAERNHAKKVRRDIIGKIR